MKNMLIFLFLILVFSGCIGNQNSPQDTGITSTSTSTSIKNTDISPSTTLPEGYDGETKASPKSEKMGADDSSTGEGQEILISDIPDDAELVEIRNYEGKKLSSVNDFRENSIKGPQRVDMSKYRLYIDGLVDDDMSLTYDQILSNYNSVKKVVTLHCVEGWSNTILYEGILLEDLLSQAGVKKGANTVIFHAYDGYTSSLPLDFVLENKIMIAYKMNEITMPEERGFPLQVIAEDKWGYKWVKWLTKIELSDNQDYKGFWESRGYNNNAKAKGEVRA